MKHRDVANVTPLRGELLLLVARTKSYSGPLYVPEVAREREQTGRVVRVGEGGNSELDGKIVVFANYRGRPLFADETDKERKRNYYLLVKEEDIEAIVEVDE